MPPAVTVRDYLWAGAWAAAIAFVQVQLVGLEPQQIPQFLIQFALVALGITLPGLLAWNFLPKRPSRVPLRWQFVVLLGLASILAVSPWNSAVMGCPDC
jgi:hypothetical protein